MMFSIQQNSDSFSGTVPNKPKTTFSIMLSYLHQKSSSRLFKTGFIILILIVIYIGMYVTHHNLTDFMVVGGVLGFISSLIVMVELLFKEKDGSMQLLFWRAFADLGIAVRFLAVHPLNQLVCSLSICENFNRGSSPENCGFPSAFLEFFEIASEMWFLCVTIDLWKSIANPFASSASWMLGYHVAVWSISIAFAAPMWVLPKIHGYYMVDDEVEDTAICWVSNTKENTFWIYFMFYIPLAIVYLLALLSLVYGYRRLRHGISSTVIHRMRALVTNAINVFTYMLYWSLLALLLLLSFTVPDHQDANGFFTLLIFLIASKGVSALIVRILTVDIAFVDANVIVADEVEKYDLNAALRQELLYFATSGIRKCTENGGADLRRNQTKLVVTLQRAPELITSADDLSPWFFIFLILGREKEKRKVIELANMMRKKRRELTALEVAVRDDNSITQAEEEHLSENLVSPDECLRLSQRPTLVAGTGGLNTTLLDVIDLEEGRDTNLSKNSTTRSLPEVRGYQSEFGRQSEVVVTNVGDSENDATILKRISAFFDRFNITSSDVEFVEMEPYHFRRIRRSQRITDDEYIWQFKTTIKERVTQGGASGALFFYSRDEMFIAKSCTESEFAVLNKNAKNYADYFESVKGASSFIGKIYGAYKIKLNNFSIWFYVMNNLFYGLDENGQKVAIHEKYDIKGSTVNRSSVPPQQGQQVTCRNCNRKFIYRRKRRGRTGPPDASSSFRAFSVREDFDIEMPESKCEATVSGEHEPNVILKDNDLKYKLRLPYSVSKELILQLEWDAEFLLEIGVMDYSLLLGVHNTEYAVRGDGATYGPLSHSSSLQDSGKPQSSAPRDSAQSAVSSTSIVSSTAPRKSKGVSFASPWSTESSKTINPLTNQLEMNGQFNSDSSTSMGLSTSSRPTTVSTSSADVALRDTGISAMHSDISFASAAAAKFKRLEVSRVVGPDSYQMGIIDFQQQWTLSKKLERFIKVRLKGEDAYGLSAIEPEIYKERFVNHIRDILELEQTIPTSIESIRPRAISKIIPRIREEGDEL